MFFRERLCATICADETLRKYVSGILRILVIRHRLESVKFYILILSIRGCLQVRNKMLTTREFINIFLCVIRPIEDELSKCINRKALER